MNTRWWRAISVLPWIAAVCIFVGLAAPHQAEAHNLRSYSDTISDSAPNAYANHTFAFTVTKPVDPGSVFTFSFPSDFSVSASSTFGIRDVQMFINGVARDAATTSTASNDGISITTGSGGKIVYTLSSTQGIAAGAQIELRVGNNTTHAIKTTTSVVSVGTSTATTTVTHPGDEPPITNSPTLGTHSIHFTITGSADQFYSDFFVSMVSQVGVGPANTHRIFPPIRYNGAPTGTLSGTTQFVEISLNTDTWATCKYATTTGITFPKMPYVFSNTGFTQIQHSTVVGVKPDRYNYFYVRCIDKEGNYNTTDYVISFYVPKSPTGTANTQGSTSGNGTGSGDTGTGSGQGTGGTTGGSSGQASTQGSLTGGGGSGGGGGGGAGSASSPGSGGGPDSGVGPYPSGDAQVIFNGYAYPDSTVTVLVDGKTAGTTRAGGDGRYSYTIDKIAHGVYTFGVYATDANGVQSSTFSTSFTVTGSKTSSLSNVVLAPTIKVTPNPVDPGKQVTFTGYALPNAVVTIENQEVGASISRKTATTTAAGNGAWSYTLDTTGFSVDKYEVRARAASPDGTVASDFSNYTFYGVGKKVSGGKSADLNQDGKVNLTDFSILLFWWNTAGGNSNPPADINQDGTVNLVDFSIMLFQWTG